MKHPAFDILPYVGALPLKFGTEKAEIPSLLGFAPKINKTAVSKAILLYCQIAIVSIVQMMRAYTNTGIFSSPSVGHNM